MRLIGDLPREVLVKIFQALGNEFQETYPTLCLVNKHFRDVANDPELWRSLTLTSASDSAQVVDHISRCSLLQELRLWGEKSANHLFGHRIS